MNQTNPYQAISDANRRKILDLLRVEGPMRAGDIVTQLSHISQPAVSKHLRVLRQADLVHDVQDGRERWYRLNPSPLHGVAQWLQQYETLWAERLETLKEIVERAEQTDRSPTEEGDS